jgi:sporulation protein Cse60
MKKLNGKKVLEHGKRMIKIEIYETSDLSNLEYEINSGIKQITEDNPDDEIRFIDVKFTVCFDSDRGERFYNAMLIYEISND